MNASLFIANTGQSLTRAERRAQNNWEVEQIMPGEDVRCLALDPFDSRVIYAGTGNNGVLRSQDQGRSWTHAGLEFILVRALAPSPHEAGVIYAGARPASVFVTRDAGATWTELEGFRKIRGRWSWWSPAEPPDFRPHVQGLAISPTDANTILAGIEFGAVVRTTNGGLTWSTPRPGALRDCHTLIFHARNPNWAYEGGGGGAAVSRDGGLTWQQPKDGLDRRYGWACAADPQRPEVWYTSASPMVSASMVPAAHIDGKANAYIYRSAGGAAWEQLSGGLPQPLNYMAYALLTDPEESGHLYAGMSNGEVWFSSDYGDSWQKLPFNLGGIHRSLVMIL